MSFKFQNAKRDSMEKLLSILNNFNENRIVDFDFFYNYIRNLHGIYDLEIDYLVYKTILPKINFSITSEYFLNSFNAQFETFYFLKNFQKFINSNNFIIKFSEFIQNLNLKFLDFYRIVSETLNLNIFEESRILISFLINFLHAKIIDKNFKDIFILQCKKLMEISLEKIPFYLISQLHYIITKNNFFENEDFINTTFVNFLTSGIEYKKNFLKNVTSQDLDLLDPIFKNIIEDQFKIFSPEEFYFFLNSFNQNNSSENSNENISEIYYFDQIEEIIKKIKNPNKNISKYADFLSDLHDNYINHNTEDILSNVKFVHITRIFKKIIQNLKYYQSKSLSLESFINFINQGKKEMNKSNQLEELEKKLQSFQFNDLNRLSSKKSYKQNKINKLKTNVYNLKENEEDLKISVFRERNITNRIFKFPSKNIKSSSLATIEIPFNFESKQNKEFSSISQEEKISSDKSLKKENINETHLEKSNTEENLLCLNSFIKIQSTPVLYIDLSNKQNIENTRQKSKEYEMKLEEISLNKQITSLSEEISKLNADITKLKIELLNKNNYITNIKNEFVRKEEHYFYKIKDLTMLNEELAKSNRNLAERLIHIEREYKEFIQMNNNTKLNNQNMLSPNYKVTDEQNFDIFLHSSKIISSKKDFLENKFSFQTNGENYIYRCLNKDILDFQEYTKEKMKILKSTQLEIINLLNECISHTIPDFEIRLFGSHATNLCLHWSDLDIVLVQKNTSNNITNHINQKYSNLGVLNQLYLKILDKPWKKSIKFIDSASIPLIKILTTEKYFSLQIDISIQDSRHYGLKCVDLVKSYLEEYQALEPLVFSLKNLLKMAELNDPYKGGLSSYGLILMIVSFLQNKNNKNIFLNIFNHDIDIQNNEYNLGRLFLEFLYYYGISFKNSQNIVTTKENSQSESFNNELNIDNSCMRMDINIIDPLDQNNNVGKSTYQFNNIKMAFTISYFVCFEECECNCIFNNKSDGLVKVEHSILKKIFHSVRRHNMTCDNFYNL